MQKARVDFGREEPRARRQFEPCRHGPCRDRPYQGARLLHSPPCRKLVACALGKSPIHGRSSAPRWFQFRSSRDSFAVWKRWEEALCDPATLADAKAADLGQERGQAERLWWRPSSAGRSWDGEIEDNRAMLGDPELGPLAKKAAGSRGCSRSPGRRDCHPALAAGSE